MEMNVVDPKNDVASMVRYGLATKRPLSAPQPLWQGALPPGVKQIMTREALKPSWRECYAKWASNFALLKDDFLAQVFEREGTKLARSARGTWWPGTEWVDWHSCNIGDDLLLVEKQDGGWTVELCPGPPSNDPDGRIVTIENMPVLCPDAPRAALLARACYPDAPAPFVWHSYW
jgi:hypothetical protein